jgi:hypothetical protein
MPCPNGCSDGACVKVQCAGNYNPVCSNGRTFTNKCFAENEGVTNYTRGACGEVRHAIKISQGWNLIAIPGDMGMSLGTCSDSLKNQWAFFWWYPPEARFVSMREGEMFSRVYWEYLRKTAFWAYSPESCELDYLGGNYYAMTSSVQQIQGGWNNELPQMYAGWNMAVFTPDMLGKKLDDFRGECRVKAAFIFDSGAWTSIINQTIPSDESVLGHGFVLNVANDCKLGGIAVTPPAFPTGWVLAGSG